MYLPVEGTVVAKPVGFLWHCFNILRKKTVLAIAYHCKFPSKTSEKYMQQIFSAITQSLVKRVLLIGLMSLLSLSSLFVFTNQPAFADKLLEKSTPSEAAIDRAYELNEAAGFKEEDRLEAYEEATEAVADPKAGLEKIYEEDLKAYKKETSRGNPLVEGAKDIVEKVTGK
jgi:hypothetical protein